MEKEIADFLAYIGTERGLSPKTAVAYKYDLTKFCQFVEKEKGKGYSLSDIDQYTIKSFMQFLAEKGYKKSNSAVSRGRKLATLKSFFKYLADEGRAKSDIVRIKMPKVQQKEPAYLTGPEYKRLLKSVKRNATEYFRLRDMAIINLFLGMGLRLNELVELNVGDVYVQECVMKVTRKGNKERMLPANKKVIVTIQQYLKTRDDLSPKAPLFMSKRNKRISTGSVWHLVKKYLQLAQIEKDRLSPHTLRHTFATTLLKQGENILTIKELMSHRNLRTTERYLHISDEDLKTAVGRIDLSI